MTEPYGDMSVVGQPEPLEPEDAAQVAPRDSEIDFDDEHEEGQLPIDVIEATEAGVLLDDPEALSAKEE
ncbi:MAG TPA: hypothetical protein VMU99_05900 [Acidimicrobiales bacterium]|nr:hypothetical protein [Acidimicrobiales bacterium]